LGGVHDGKEVRLCLGGSSPHPAFGRLHQVGGDVNLADAVLDGLAELIIAQPGPAVHHQRNFDQADTAVPGAGNPAAWNRYAYVMYNPVKYVDPSGHWWVYGDPTVDDFDPQARWANHASNEGSTSYAPVTTFEFNPVLLTGGVGEVQAYSQEPEDDYNDFMWGGVTLYLVFIIKCHSRAIHI